MSCKNTESWNFRRALTQSGLSILYISILLVAVLLKHFSMWKAEVAIMLYFVKQLFLQESREVTCSLRRMLEKFFWTSSLLIQLLFRYFFKGYTYNPEQNIWNKLEKSSKTGQDKRSLISTFACFLTGTAKV